MAIHAQSSCTLSTITDVEAVYTYYYLSDSTITVNEAPKDGINPPGASTITITSDGHDYIWQITEPQLNIQDNIIQTAVGKLYYIECVKFSDGTYDWGPLMTSSTYAAAKAAYNLSSQALSQAQIAHAETALLGGHFVYNSEWETEHTPHSANVIEIAQIEQESEEEGEDSTTIDVTDDPTQWGYNVHIGSNGIKLRKNELTLSDWTEDALTFYTPHTNALEISTQLNQEGMIVNQGGIMNNKLDYFPTLDIECDPNKTYYLQNIQTIPVEGGETQEVVSYEVVSNPDDNDIASYYEYGFNERVKLFLSTEGYGTNYTINNYETDKWRQIIGRYFGVTDEGYLYCSGAYINGKLDVIAGSNVYTKNEAQARLAELASTTGADKWKDAHSNYSLTTDTMPNENIIYYQAIYDYFPTSDTTLQNKDYYTQTIGTDEEQTITYDLVTTPSETDIETYFEYGITGYEEISLQPNDNPYTMGLYILDTISESINDYIQTHLSVEEDGLWLKGNNNDFKLQLTNKGMMVYDTSGDLVSTFGENIIFSSNRQQKIGGANTYIEFIPGNENEPESLIINASYLHIGSTSVIDKFSDLDSKYQIQSSQINGLINDNNILDQRITGVSEATETFKEELEGYIDINTQDSIMRIGKRTGINNNINNSNEFNSYIEINASNPNDMKISINMEGNQVAYFNNERLYAPSAVVTNLYMQTKTGEGKTKGTMGWLMRANGHLSLKEIATNNEENE